MPRLSHFRREVGPAGDHLVMYCDRTDEIALAAGFGGLQTQKPDDIAGIRMPGQVGAGVISAMGAVVEITPCQVLDVAEDVSFSVLRHSDAES